MKTIVIGDVHGCLEEFDELLKLCSYRQGEDKLILVGDLIDRGPDSVGVVRRSRELRAKVTLGNHERKFLKWVSKSNTYAPDDRPHYYKLNNDDIEYMKSMPLYVEIKPNLYVIHGGARPGVPIIEQTADDLCHLRYTDINRKFISLHHIFKHGVEASGAHFWTSFWQGPESIIYGHNVHNFDKPVIEQRGPDVTCYGIDTGACFGGHLTALVLEGDKITTVQVKAKQVYFKSGFKE